MKNPQFEGSTQIYVLPGPLVVACLTTIAKSDPGFGNRRVSDTIMFVGEPAPLARRG
jgi:hypothetical protein